MSHHVVVVVGGVIGVCAAYYLARAGASVTLLERADIAAGSSHGNAGLIVPSHAVPLAAPGVLWQGLKWMADPESPFWIRPRLDPGLAAWLSLVRALQGRGWRVVAAVEQDVAGRLATVRLAVAGEDVRE